MGGTDTTTHDDTGTFARREPAGEGGLGLVIAWSRDEPERVGELVYLPPRDERVYVLGRGDGPPERSGHLRALPLRQRPGGTEIAPPLTGARLSRDQLRIERVDHTTLAIENIGRRPVRVRARETRHVVAHAHDVIVVEGLLVLLCVGRPPSFPPLRHMAAEAFPAFGEPDRWGLVGESAAIWTLRDAVAFAAREPGHVLVHGPVGSGKSLVARGLGAGVGELDAAATAPSELRARALEVVGAARTLAVAGIEHLGDLGADHLGRLLDELAHRGVRVVGMTTAEPGALKTAPRSRFVHLVATPALGAHMEDVPLLLRAIALRTLPSAPGSPRRIGPSLVEALLVAPPDTGAHGLETALWQSLRESSGEWLELRQGPPSALGQSPPPREPVPMAPERALDDDDDEDGDDEPVEALLASELPPSVMSGLSNLTRAERIVLQHVALSRTSRQIARALFVSVRTVQNHRAHICEKLGLQGHNRLLAVAMALKRVLGPPPSG